MCSPSGQLLSRAGQVKASNHERITDRIDVDPLTSMFPPALVEVVLEETSQVERRHRLLPARVVIYFTLADIRLCAGEDVVRRQAQPGLKGIVEEAPP